MSTQAHASGTSADNKSRTVPQWTTGPGSRFLTLGLAVVLLVGACGGDQDGDPGSSADDTPARASATPEAGPDDSMGADPITSTEQTDPSAPDTASEAAPLDSTSGTETQDSVPEALSQPVVLLGDRFEWCAEVQAVWDAHDQAMAALVAAEARHEEALKDYEAAADELDRAEAREVVDAANADVGRANDDFQQALTEAVQQLLYAKNIGGDATHHVAYRRAWQALIEGSPQMRAADTEWEKAQAPSKLRYAQNILSEFERGPAAWDTAWDFATKAEQLVHQAVSIAERTSADPADIAALRDSVLTRLEAHSDAVTARILASDQADIDSSRSVAELFQEARKAFSSAVWAKGNIRHHYDEGLAAKDDIASAGTARKALAAFTKAVEHLLLVFDAYDEWADAHGEAQRIAKLAESTPLPQDVVDTADAMLAAEASFEASVEAAALDADAHSAFRRSFHESCR